MVHKHPKAKLQAYGYDEKGRKQFIYHTWFLEQQKVRKFNMITRHHAVFQKIMHDVQKEIRQGRAPYPKQFLICLVLCIMIECNFRIGNEKYKKENQHYGVTTLEWKHVRFPKSGGVEFNFVGKKGVVNHAVCTDPWITKHLRKMAKVAKRSGSTFDSTPVFPEVRSADVNAFLKQYHPDITAKGIRLWQANRLFAEYFAETKSVKEAVAKVAEALHNTPTVCKSSYLHPHLLK